MPESDFRNIQVFIRKLGRPVFTTHELTAISGRSSSTVVQSLNRLIRQDLLIKPYRGVWAERGRGEVSAFTLIPHVFAHQRVYVSFITALHLHGIVEQIPQVITLASLSHSRTVKTALAVYSVHQVAPDVFGGFEWAKGEGTFLVAEQEKALIDSLYLSSRRKKQFAHFPELHFPSSFSFRKAEEWIRLVPEANIRQYVMRKLDALRENRASDRAGAQA